MSQLLRVVCASVAGCAVLGTSDAGASVSLEVKAYTGVQAPGAAPGLILHGLGNAVVNDAGEVAFLGHVSDPVQDIGGGVIFGPDASGNLTPVAVTFEPVPGLPPDSTFLFHNFTYFPRLDDAGSVVFYADLSGPGISYPSDSSGIWRWSAESGLERLARAGDPLPEAGSGVVLGKIEGRLHLPTNGEGDIVHFDGSYIDPVLQEGEFALFTAGASGVAPIVATGAPVPGVPGAVFSFLSAGIVSDSGDWGFDAAFEGPGVVAGVNDTGSFIWRPSTGVSLRMRAGDAAPATAEGVVLASIGGTYPNAAGQFAYLSRIAGPGVGEENDSILYGPTGPGALALLAREGHPAAGTEPGTVFGELRSFSMCVVIDAGGKVAFTADLTGLSVTPANDVGIWRSDPATGGIARLVREGDPAPELPGLSVDAISCPIQNDRGDLVFAASLAGPGVELESDRALFAISADGTKKKVFREGDLVPFGPGDLRPLIWFSLLDGVLSGVPGVGQLSDNGHLTFVGHTPDGTNAVVVATIPEPGFASGLAAGLVLLAGLARSRGRR